MSKRQATAYYVPEDRTIVLNRASGMGCLTSSYTLTCKIRFEMHPPWFNEGLASLFERPGQRDGRIYGGINWRLPLLKKAIEKDRVVPFKKLLGLPEGEFYGRYSALHYAQSRFLCYYLQEIGRLREFFHEFRLDQDIDRTGLLTLKRTLDVDNLASFEVEWTDFVMKLSLD